MSLVSLRQITASVTVEFTQSKFKVYNPLSIMICLVQYVKHTLYIKTLCLKYIFLSILLTKSDFTRSRTAQTHRKNVNLHLQTYVSQLANIITYCWLSHSHVICHMDMLKYPRYRRAVRSVFWGGCLNFYDSLFGYLCSCNREDKRIPYGLH